MVLIISIILLLISISALIFTICISINAEIFDRRFNKLKNGQ